MRLDPEDDPKVQGLPRAERRSFKYVKRIPKAKTLTPQQQRAKRTRIKRQSQKQAILEAKRRVLRRQWFADAAARTEIGQALCEQPIAHVCHGVATDAHEKVSRARCGDILERKNVLLLCHDCHMWAHAHPAEATGLGMLESQHQPMED